MKQKGGVPPVFRKGPKYTDEDYERLDRRIAVAVKKSIPPEPQPTKPSITQFFKKPRSPFTGPGPSTAGRKRYRRTRKVRRRS